MVNPYVLPKFGHSLNNGFIKSVLVPATDEKGEITDIKVTQPESFAAQML
ncbi:MAG: hypothetical protein ABFR05_13045 [Bacteroidota bacterium]